MAVQLGVSVQGIQEVMQGFAKLAPGLQKKYLRAAVNKVTKPHTKTVKALVNRGPTGNLRRSVGVATEAKVKGRTQTAVLGFRRGKEKNQLGFHAWWIEHGVKARVAKRGLWLITPWGRRRAVAGFAGTGNFGRWADSTLPSIRDALQVELVSALGKATAEAARRAKRAAEGKK